MSSNKPILYKSTTPLNVLEKVAQWKFFSSRKEKNPNEIDEWVERINQTVPDLKGPSIKLPFIECVESWSKRNINLGLSQLWPSYFSKWRMSIEDKRAWP